MTPAPLIVLTVDGDRVVDVTLHDGGRAQPVGGVPTTAAPALDTLVRRFPAHHLAWRDRAAEAALTPVEGWPVLLRHDLEVRHGAYLHGGDPGRASLGAVEFLSPFQIDAPRDRAFGTWMLSPLAGIAPTDVLRACGPPPDGLSLAAALLVLGHRAMTSGALLWSDPRLGAAAPVEAPALSAREAALVVRHGVGRRFLLLWLAAQLPDRRLPLAAAVAATARPAAPFTPAPPESPPSTGQRAAAGAQVDVVTATMGRRDMLLEVLGDLSGQTVPPCRVVVVEQVPPDVADPGPLEVGDTPYELVYRRLRVPGACNARNVGLGACRAPWVMLVDDDMRFVPTYIEAMIEVAELLRVDGVVAGAAIVDVDGDPYDVPAAEHGDWPRMWPNFGAGAALAARRLFDEVGGFDRRLEGGFGEDYEWGVRARLAGAMVVHAPGIRVAHRHAPTGGFRTTYPHPWHTDPVPPVPSPTVILSHRLWESPLMRRGWVVHYWLRRLSGRWRTGPVTMRRQWRAAHRWADELERSQDPRRARAIAH